MSEDGKPTELGRLVCTITLYPDGSVGCELEGHHLPASSKQLSRMFAMAHENLGEVQGRLLGSGEASGAGFTIDPQPTTARRLPS